jgi:hypothetical protein
MILNIIIYNIKFFAVCKHPDMEWLFLLCQCLPSFIQMTGSKLITFIKAFVVFGCNYEYSVLYVVVKHWYLDITRE